MSEEIKGMIYDCPKCSWPMSNYDRFCGHCGAVLPLPKTIKGLEAQLEVDDMPGNSHSFSKEVMGNIFCSLCGKRL